MKQVTQTLRTGVVEVRDVPVPTLQDSFILVRNAVSLISAGTERSIIQTGKMNLFQKARARPDLVRRVMKMIQRQGLAQTADVVRERLNAVSPLGNSCAGSVIAVGGAVEGIRPGDRVACGGAGYANHADIVAVPKNLVAAVPDGVSDAAAAFTTIGAIALQGVRLAEPKLGETFLVLGLGLVGQIAAQLLRANGCTVIGSDPDQDLVARAETIGAIGIKTDEDAVATCMALTQDQGVDGVIVCAGTKSNQPIELSGDVTREQGRVIVIGAVGMDIPRDEYYRKEIRVVISRSYGPGRYDPDYEVHGHDYPYGYVRFTEGRNMQAFLGLVASGAVRLDDLISHRFDIERAVEAFDLVEGKTGESSIGVLLEYPASRLPVAEAPSLASTRVAPTRRAATGDAVEISFIGAGNYATANLLPVLKEDRRVSLAGLVTASGRSAQSVAERFGFSHCAADVDELLNASADAVVIATRHDTHADIAAKALDRGKHVYVEKPLALDMGQLKVVAFAHAKADGHLMVGFNRRFAPATRLVIDHFDGAPGPRVVNIRVNAGEVPRDNWIQDAAIGGGRLIGEGCHFVDLAAAIVGGKPKSVFAVGAESASKSAIINDNLVVSLTFDGRSIANIVYASSGPNSMAKERIEVFGGGLSAVIDDFGAVTLFDRTGKTKRRRFAAQDKGQKDMLDRWVDSVRSGEPCVPFDTLMAVSMATILAVESMMVNAPLDIDPALLDEL